jgi:hypothetical protein
MLRKRYVLLTSARDEQATIKTTIDCVLAQTVPPREWVIISDGSTDATNTIVRDAAHHCNFINFIALPDRRTRTFAAVVENLKFAYANIREFDYDFVGVLDGDVRFSSEYYECLMERFESDPRLGLAGGLVLDCIRGVVAESTPHYLRDVAGATQFFTRACFGAFESFVPIPEGGWDAITCVRARMNGYKTETFADLVVEHLKPRNAAFGRPLARKWQMGKRDYAVGNHPLFQLAKCLFRAFEKPIIASAAARLGAYSLCLLLRKERMLPRNVLDFIQAEQLARVAQPLSGFGKRAHSRKFETKTEGSRENRRQDNV